MANVKRAALAKARERRLALDRDRQARDSRVEQAAARVFLGVEQRHVAERACQADPTHPRAAATLASTIAANGFARLKPRR